MKTAKHLRGAPKSILFAIIIVAANGGMALAEVVLTATSAGNMPGADVNVALLLKTEEKAIDELKIAVKIPPQLEYVKVSLGISSELAGVQMEVETGDSLAIQLKGGGSGVPDGLVASLDFKIKTDAEIGTILKVEPKASAQSVQGEEVVVRAEAGEIEITAAPPLVSACFFYMH